jgi:hypothetical protein
MSLEQLTRFQRKLHRRSHRIHCPECARPETKDGSPVYRCVCGCEYNESGTPTDFDFLAEEGPDND